MEISHKVPSGQWSHPVVTGSLPVKVKHSIGTHYRQAINSFENCDYLLYKLPCDFELDILLDIDRDSWTNKDPDTKHQCRTIGKGNPNLGNILQLQIKVKVF